MLNLPQWLSVLGVFAVGVFGSGYLIQNGHGKGALLPIVLAILVVVGIASLAMEEQAEEGQDKAKSGEQSTDENVERKERNRD